MVPRALQHAGVDDVVEGVELGLEVAVADLDADAAVGVVEVHAFDAPDARPDGVRREHDGADHVRGGHAVGEEVVEDRAERGDGEEFGHEEDATGEVEPGDFGLEDLLLHVAEEARLGLAPGRGADGIGLFRVRVLGSVQVALRDGGVDQGHELREWPPHVLVILARREELLRVHSPR